MQDSLLLFFCSFVPSFVIFLYLSPSSTKNLAFLNLNEVTAFSFVGSNDFDAMFTFSITDSMLDGAVIDDIKNRCKRLSSLALVTLYRGDLGLPNTQYSITAIDPNGLQSRMRKIARKYIELTKIYVLT